MPKHPLAALLEKHLKEIHCLADEFQDDISETLIHQLRVETKRMRAVLRFLRFFEPGLPYGRMYKPFRKLFHAAGALREIHLQQQLLKAAPVAPSPFVEAYESYLEGKQGRAERFLSKVLHQKLPQGANTVKEAGEGFDKLSKNDLKNYFLEKEKEIHALRTYGRALRTANIHPLRKALKDYNNNRRNVVKALEFDPGPVQGLPDLGTDAEQQLGDWNDYFTALLHLRNAKRLKWAAPFKAEAADLETYWKTQQAALLATLQALHRPNRVSSSG